MEFRQPIQPRAHLSTQRFLDALGGLLQEKCYSDISIEEIAGRAKQTKSAFLKRFGTKEQSLYVLFSVYADEVSASMTRLVRELDDKTALEDLFFGMSFHFERMLKKHFSANRAMNENFNRTLEHHPITERIFAECVEMMRVVQGRYLPEGYSESGAKASAQLLVSLKFHYLLNIMPAFPADQTERHRLIADLLSLALRK